MLVNATSMTISLDMIALVRCGCKEGGKEEGRGGVCIRGKGRGG